jgi:hypothetical protein
MTAFEQGKHKSELIEFKHLQPIINEMILNSRNMTEDEHKRHKKAIQKLIKKTITKGSK